MCNGLLHWEEDMSRHAAVVSNAAVDVVCASSTSTAGYSALMRSGQSRRTPGTLRRAPCCRDLQRVWVTHTSPPTTSSRCNVVCCPFCYTLQPGRHCRLHKATPVCNRWLASCVASLTCTRPPCGPTNSGLRRPLRCVKVAMVYVLGSLNLTTLKRESPWGLAVRKCGRQRRRWRNGRHLRAACAHER